MDKVAVSCYVFFEDPFWIGLLERTEKQRLSVCKVMFGAEPKDYEVWAFLLANYDRLQFSPAVESVQKEKSRNPKRVQREVKRQVNDLGVGTKSQQALKLLQEERKTDRQQTSRRLREEEKERQFEQKQLKRKEKHKGR